MKNKIQVKKIPAVLLIAAALVTALSLPYTASAAGTNSLSVLPDLYAGMLEGLADTLIDGFDSTVDVQRWTVSGSVSALSAVTSFAALPGEPFSGIRCLEAEAAATGSWGYIARSYDVPLDLSGENTLFCALALPDDDAAYYVSLSLSTASDGSISRNARASGGSWNGLFLDISSLKGKDQITKIQIGVRQIANNGTAESFRFHVDTLKTSSSVNLAADVRFLTANYIQYGLTANFIDGNTGMQLTFENSAATPFIETYSLMHDAFAESNALRIKLINRSDCTAVRVYYTSEENPEFDIKMSCTSAIDAQSAAVQTCYFPVDLNLAGQIRIEFTNATQGDIQIESIMPVSYYHGYDGELGELVSCKVADNGRELIVRGTMTAEAVSKYRNTRLYLYELKSYVDEKTADYASLEPVTQSNPAEDFTLKFQLYDGQRSRLGSKFAAVLYSGGSYILLDDAHFVTNPEVLSSVSWTYPVRNLRKGIADPEEGEIYTEAQLLGSGYALVTVDLSRLISLSDNGVSSECEGVTYYYNKEYVSSLDADIGAYYRGGMNVSLSLVLQKSTDSAINRLLIHPMAELNDPSVRYYAFNTENADGIRCLRAALSFLADRYGGEDDSHGRAVNLIVGYCVNHTAVNYNMGDAPLDEMCASYERMVRLVHSTARSVGGRIRIYISLTGDRWDRALGAGESRLYDARAFLDTFAARMSGGGAISWHVAFTPAFSGDDGYAAYADALAGDRGISYHSDFSTEAFYLSAKNLEQLCQYLKRSEFLNDGAQKSVLLLDAPCGTAPDRDTALRRISDYVYTYYKINTSACAAIDCHITNLNTFSGYTNVFRRIDTAASPEVTAFVREWIGIAAWDELLTGFDVSQAVRRTVTEGELLYDLPSQPSGTASVWRFTSDSDGSDGWGAGDYCGTLRKGESFMNHDDTLFAALRSSAVSEYRGIQCRLPYARDFSCAPWISFDIQFVMLPEQVQTLELMVLVSAGDNTYLASREITGGEWNFIVLNLENFVGVKNVDGIRIWVRGTDGQDIGEPTMILSEITASSPVNSQQHIESFFAEERAAHMAGSRRTIDMRIVWILVLIIITAASLEIILVMTRVRRSADRSRQNREKDWHF